MLNAVKSPRLRLPLITWLPPTSSTTAMPMFGRKPIRGV